VWSAWFIRYCAEKGLYMLYTNFENEEALVVNHREPGTSSFFFFLFFFCLFLFFNPSFSIVLSPGINYKDGKGPNSAMVESLQGKTNFPPLSQIPLYDFHFNRIEENPGVLEGRGLYADIFNVHTE